MPEKSNFRLLALQPQLFPADPDKNINIIQELLLAKIEPSPPDLILLPENFTLLGSLQGKKYNFQIIIDFLAQLAKTLKSFLIGGSFHHLDTRSGNYFNTCYIFNRQGENIARYHKRKLFDRELKSGVIPGNSPLILNIEGWRVNVQICADFWYPELSRELLGDYDIIAVPAQSVLRHPDFQDYGRRLWHALALTRAQENSVITMVADHAGTDRKPYSAGGSSVCDPSIGLISNDLDEIHLKSADGRPSILELEVNLERLKQFRQYRFAKGLIPV
jgi:predicted amidohydrolase